MEKINKTKYKAICFLQEDKGRDIEIVLPIVYAAEKFLNCEVDFQLKWNAHLIYKNKPDFVIIAANCIGSKMYHDIAKYAYSQNIKIFSFISEGNFNEKANFDFFGFNNDRYFYQDYICCWSKRTQKYYQLKAPKQKEQFVLTGASGFDRFKFYEFMNKTEFLEKYNKQEFDKIVTYSGWAFGKIQYQQGLDELRPFYEGKPNKEHWIEEQRINVRDTLKYVIEKNPDILFVLKQHPAEYYPGLKLKEVNEMSELVHYNNVVYITGHNEGIHDLINVADVLLGFETTSAIETWLMGGTPTIFINETSDFPRVDIYKGCLLVKNGEELHQYLDEFYKEGGIKEYEQESLKKEQEKIIENSIGFSDGFNHLRHLFYLNKTLHRIDKQKIDYKISYYFYTLYLFYRVMKPFYKLQIVTSLPWFSKFNWVFERAKLKNIKVLQQKYKPFMEQFYSKNKLDLRGVSNFWVSDKLK